MKRTILSFIAIVLVFMLCATVCFAEPIIKTAEPTATAEAPAEGLTIPASIVTVILIGAAALGGSFGYYYSRKRK